MLILAVDPGANGTGWAMLNAEDGKVWNFGTLYGRKSEWEQRATQILKGYEKILSHRYIRNVLIESPVFMRGYGGYTTASTGDLVKLSMLCGAMYFMTSKKYRTVLIPPSKWKGQLPKKVCNARVTRILERQLPDETLGKISTHALDAIGIGLWALGKF